MSEPWVGRVHLRAQNDERERWIGGRREAVGRMLLSAGSRQEFETALGKALAALGYDLVRLLEATPASDALPDDPGARRQLMQMLPHARQDRPIPLGDFDALPVTHLWSETDWDALLAGRWPLWAVVDGVSWPEISALLGQSPAEHVCLYSTQNSEGRALAPWLMRVDGSAALVAALKARAPTSHAFVLFQSDRPIDELRRHLRHFTMLRTPADPVAPVYFRFYDPRVMLDMTGSMRAGFLSRFLAPFRAVIVPLSPFCLLPEGAELDGPAPTPFDDETDHTGRLLRHEIAPEQTRAAASEPLEVGEAEFERFRVLMGQRAAGKLARRLYLDHGPEVTQAECLRVAGMAAGTAARFGMTSIKQVTIIARALLIFGQDFETRHPEAHRILHDPGLLPWQKKDRLSQWFVSASLSAAPTSSTPASSPSERSPTWTL